MIVNYIIPVCNLEGSEYEERLNSLVFIIEEFLQRQDCTVELIIMEQVVGDFKEFYPGIIKRVKKKNLKNFTYLRKSHPVFNKSWLYNLGIQEAYGEHCFIAESDMFTINDTLLSSVVKFVEEYGYPWSFAWNEMRYLNKQDKDVLIESKASSLELLAGFVPYAKRQPSPGWMEGGPIYVRKSFWQGLFVGANELYSQLGAIDNDMCHRLKKLSNAYPKYPQVMFHLWHKDSPLKNAPSRKVNAALWRFVAKGGNYLKVNEMLKEYGIGNEECPLKVPSKVFMELVK